MPTIGLEQLAVVVQSQAGPLRLFALQFLTGLETSPADDVVRIAGASLAFRGGLSLAWFVFWALLAIAAVYWLYRRSPVTVTPWRRTSSGSCGSAIATRFWIWTCASSRFVPISNVTVSEYEPSPEQVDCM